MMLVVGLITLVGIVEVAVGLLGWRSLLRFCRRVDRTFHLVCDGIVAFEASMWGGWWLAAEMSAVCLSIQNNPISILASVAAVVMAWEVAVRLANINAIREAKKKGLLENELFFSPWWEDEVLRN